MMRWLYVVFVLVVIVAFLGVFDFIFEIRKERMKEYKENEKR